MKLHMRHGPRARPACCLDVAYSANYRRGELPKHTEGEGIGVMRFPLWQRQNEWMSTGGSS